MISKRFKLPDSLMDLDKDGVYENLKVLWDLIQNKPSTFPPDAHTHGDSDLLGIDWSKVLNKPSTFPPQSHQHYWADIIDPPSSGEKVAPDLKGVWIAHHNLATSSSQGTPAGSYALNVLYSYTYGNRVLFGHTFDISNPSDYYNGSYYLPVGALLWFDVSKSGTLSLSSYTNSNGIKFINSEGSSYTTGFISAGSSTSITITISTGWNFFLWGYSDSAIDSARTFVMTVLIQY